VLPLDLIVLGASARAAAQSARRAGFRPWCVDIFADTDLRAIAPARRIPAAAYPHGFVSVVRDHAPLAPVVYTGGLEDYPAILSELAQHRPIWGYFHPSPQCGDSIRNPQFVQDLCTRAGIARPGLALDPTDLPMDGSWLLKPSIGSGGLHIARWRGQPVPDPGGCFFQHHISGDSLSAIFVTATTATQLLGVTRQLIGEQFLHSPGEFVYCGNVTLDADSLTPRLFDQLMHLGNALTRADRQLRGLFGVDFILRDETVYLIEVNPRYTAAVEVLEHMTRRPFLYEHVLAFATTAHLPSSPHPTKVQAPALPVGKGIYYASRRMAFPDSLLQGPVVTDPWVVPELADLPDPGTVIETGQPVFTLLHQGPSVEAVLRQKAAAWDDSSECATACS